MKVRLFLVVDIGCKDNTSTKLKEILFGLFRSSFKIRSKIYVILSILAPPYRSDHSNTADFHPF